jgi:hypothetical protein
VAFPWPIASLIRGSVRVLIPIRLAVLSGRFPAWQCGDSGTVRGEFLVIPEYGGGVEVFSRASHGVEGRHSTPERVLHGNFRLPCANLLKAEQLRKKSRRQGAVEQPEVSAGELVDF